MRRHLVALVIAATALFSPPAVAQSSVDPDTANAVRNLMEKAGGLAHYNQMLDLTVDQLARSVIAANPGRNEQEMVSVLREVLVPEFKAIGPAIVELAVAIYAKRFTLEEIQQLNAFYDSPIGQKLVRELPDLTTELVQSAGAVAMEVTRRALDKHRETLRQRGVNVPL